MHAAPAVPQDAGFYVISLRPVGSHAPLRRAAANMRLRTFALSPWRIVPRDDAPTRAALRAALDADAVVFTSPSAVVAARALQVLAPRDGQLWLAVGASTASALARSGVVDIHAPRRMDSEGLLALPALTGVAGRSVGLVTAPGGRGVIAEALRAAGNALRRADVYGRVPTPPSAARVKALMALPSPWLLPLSSGEALQRTLTTLPPQAVERLKTARVLAASDRLAARARTAGFEDVVRAADARPASLLAAALTR